jgi:NADH:ubiquinone oxidoreductase subunit 4 (subunit M)
MGVVSALFYVLFTVISTNLLTALIGSVGLMIAFYYGLTGFACVWFYRKTLTGSLRDFVMRGVVPLLGGVVLLVVFGYGLMALWRISAPGFFKGLTLPRRSAEPDDPDDAVQAEPATSVS